MTFSAGSPDEILGARVMDDEAGVASSHLDELGRLNSYCDGACVCGDRSRVVPDKTSSKPISGEYSNGERVRSAM